MDLLLLSLVLLLITFSSLLMFAASSAHRGSLFDNADLVKMVFCLSLLKKQSIKISSFFQILKIVVEERLSDLAGAAPPDHGALVDGDVALRPAPRQPARGSTSCATLPSRMGGHGMGWE